MVSPYPFKGGGLSDYETFLGKAGTYNTRHIPTGESIPCVQPSGNGVTNCPQPSGLDMLPVATLAVGVLNLGVGIYNAYKLHKVQEKLDHHHEQIQSYLGSIQGALNGQQRTLEVLVTSQYKLSEKMDILRKEMHSGFEYVVQEIKDVEASRRRREFYANTHELLEVYERFVDHLPDLGEADRLIDRAEKLEALLRAELSQVPPGKECRLPLVVALAFSVRAKADAFEAKGGKYSESAEKALKKLQEQICKEAYSLCNHRSLYALGVKIPEIIYQYALLKRGIQKGIELRLNPENEFVLYPNEINWDDGLDAFRSIFNKTFLVDGLDALRSVFDKNSLAGLKLEERISSSTKISLKTLADYDWYVRFANKNRIDFDVHSCQSILLSEILKKVGHLSPTDVVIYKHELNSLMLFALPEAATKFEDYLQKEFQWEQRPKLSTPG